MVTPAKIGQVVQTKDAGEMKVHESCGGSRGQWYCITCDETFLNQFYKDSHIRKGEHQLAWICPYHGLEVP